MKKTLSIPLAVVALVLAASCTNKQGETEASVFVTVSAGGPLSANVGTPVPLTDTFTLTSTLKSDSQTDPQGFATMIVQSYTVHFRRTDGGTVVPSDETFAASGTLPAGGALTLSGLTILPVSAIQASPFDQLLPFNGGVDRETGKTQILMAFDVAFFGHTVAGQRVLSETATGAMSFMDTSSASRKSVR